MTKRKQLAGALITLVCLFGFSAGAAADNKGHHKRVDPKSVVSDQDAPKYLGRKPGDHPKLDEKLNERANLGGSGFSRVIVVLKSGCSIDSDLSKVGGLKGRVFQTINGVLAQVPNGGLRKLANSSCVAAMHHDRKTGGEMNRVAVMEGARAAQLAYGLDGAGVGVAVIDSGIVGWHDDLTYSGSNRSVKVVNGQRVTKFVDFVNNRTMPYDDNGHGTHVAGIIAGNGYDTLGLRAGMAPAADIVSLKVLDDHGGGYISNVIAALDWVVANRTLYNIRVVNLSVGAAVTESYTTDPLTLAAKRVVDAGVVVVTAAGNLGRSKTTGAIQYGAITAPGNAPWVLTVGAYNHEGTLDRSDDKMADFSSRGPTARDFLSKPDVVAAGVGVASLSAPGSLLYSTKATALLGGLLSSTAKPYLSLSGTSMAAPVVTGTVALMMQANPKLTPNLAKAIIEYTAQIYPGYSPLDEGAGFLNTKGAVDLARFLAHPHAGDRYPSNTAWGKRIIWGNRLMTRGVLKPAGSAWAVSTVWGSFSDRDGDNIVWGTRCASTDPGCQNVMWGSFLDLDADNIVWGTVANLDRDVDNIVWGTIADGDSDNIVWGTMADGDADNIVWGTTCGGADCTDVVWSTAAGCSSADADCDNIVWGSNVDGDVDNIVWGSSSEPDNQTWGCSGEDVVVYDDPLTPTDSVDFDALFGTSTSGPGSDPAQPAPVGPVPVPPPADVPLTDSLISTQVEGGSF